MSQQNRISATVSQEQKVAIQSGIDGIKTALSDILIHSLTPKERKTIVKMGDKTVAFVQKSLDYADSNLTLAPAYLDIAEAQKDLKLSLDLQSIFNQLSALTTALEDAMIISGSEAYNGALIFYNSVQGAVRSNVPGSQSILDELKQRFPGRGNGGDTAAAESKA